MKENAILLITKNVLTQWKINFTKANTDDFILRIQLTEKGRAKGEVNTVYYLPSLTKINPKDKMK